MNVLKTLTLGTILGFSAFASDEEAAAKLEAAQEHFANRMNLEENDLAITTLREAKNLAQDPYLKLEIEVLLSRAFYWKGANTSNRDEKIVIFEQGYQAADGAKSTARATGTEVAEPYYYYSINLARWAEARGVLESISRKDELFQNLNRAVALITMNGEAGETVDGYGPRRTLGRTYHKLPGLLGGSYDRSVENLERAVTNAPTWALNTIYLADTLISKRGTKARGCQILRDILATDSNTLNPDRVPETNLEKREGQAIYNRECQ